MYVYYQISLLAFLLVPDRSLASPVQDASDPGMPFQLTVTPALVNRYTATSMTLRCQHNPLVRSKMVEIFRMRILKQSGSGWELLAEQRDNEANPAISGNVTAALASVRGDVSFAFLQVSWDTIGQDCFGVFKCEVIGFDTNVVALTERSSTVEVHEFKNFVHHLISKTVETQEKMEEMKNFTDTEITRIENRFEHFVKSVEGNQSSIITDLRTLEVKQNSLQLRIGLNEISISQLKNDWDMPSTRTNQSSSDLQLSSLIQWPAGYYALLQPKTGCPLDLAFYGGSHHYMKIHTESQSSSDPSSLSSSAFGITTISRSGSKRFVTLEFCEVTTQVNTGVWPQGSFCINQLKHKICPAGFTRGYVRFDTEDTDDSSYVRNNVAECRGYCYLYFCCQNTTSAPVPIQLPTDSPFLLYRYGGVCQAVQGMSVSQEYIQINTEDTNNNDGLFDDIPDVDRLSSSVLKINLCYYTKL